MKTGRERADLIRATREERAMQRVYEATHPNRAPYLLVVLFLALVILGLFALSLM